MRSFYNIFEALTFEAILDAEIFIKFAPTSVAIAFASMVFPVPGGPNRSIPLQGWRQYKFS